MKRKNEIVKTKNNGFLTIFICIFLSLVLVFGAVMGIVVAVNNSRTVVRYGGVSITEGEARYLASIYKKDFIRTVNAMGDVKASDTDAFWSSESYEAGVSYGELLERGFKEYLAGVAIRCSLYIDNAKFGSDEKKLVKEKVDKRLSYLDCKTPEGLDKMSDSLGFDYDDMLDGSELLYQSAMAYSMIYGNDGTNLANYPDECEKYLAEYTHVFLIFLRDSDVYVLDEGGNVTYDSDGNIIKREQTAEERAQREQSARELREYIDNYKNGVNNAISPETFEIYMKTKSDTDPNMFTSGYYFNLSAEVTAQFAEVYPEVVTEAFDMEIGEYSEVKCSDSTCFIYRAPVREGAYRDSENPFFSDFFSDGSRALFTEAIELLAEDVEFGDRLCEIDLLAIPSNKEHYVNF